MTANGSFSQSQPARMPTNDCQQQEVQQQLSINQRPRFQLHRFRDGQHHHHASSHTPPTVVMRRSTQLHLPASVSQHHHNRHHASPGHQRLDSDCRQLHRRPSHLTLKMPITNEDEERGSDADIVDYGAVLTAPRYYPRRGRTNPIRALDTPLPQTTGNVYRFTAPVAALQQLSAGAVGNYSAEEECFMAVVSDSGHNVDYRLPHPSRPLEVKVAGRSIFVNPEAIQNLSPMLTQFFVREAVAGKRHTVESQLESLNYNDVLTALCAVCPTELGMFPTPVRKDTFGVLIRLATKYKVSRLRLACEQFVALLPIRVDQLSADEAVDFLSLSIKYDLSDSAKVRLLTALMCIQLSVSMSPTGVIAAHPSVEPVVYDLFACCYPLCLDGEVYHEILLDEARLKVPCALCRRQPTLPACNVFSATLKDGVVSSELSDPVLMLPRRRFKQNAFLVCSNCRETLCADCVDKPCSVQLEPFLRKFGCL